MDRKFLESLDIDETNVEKIMAEHGKVVNPLKQKEEQLETEVESYKEQITDRDTQLEELQGKVGTEDDLKATIETLKNANKEKDDQHNEKLKQQKLDYELKIALNNSGARNERAVKALLDLDTVKINDDGQLIGLDEQLNTLKTSDDYLFTSDQSNEDKKDNPSATINFNPSNGQRKNTGKDPDPSEVGKSAAERLYGKKEEE